MANSKNTQIRKETEPHLTAGEVSDLMGLSERTMQDDSAEGGVLIGTLFENHPTVGVIDIDPSKLKTNQDNNKPSV